MDDAEYGAAAAKVYEAAAWHNHRLRASALYPGGRAATECEDCGEPISKERREAMEKMGMTCTRCVDCQAKTEGR